MKMNRKLEITLGIVLILLSPVCLVSFMRALEYMSNWNITRTFIVDVLHVFISLGVFLLFALAVMLPIVGGVLIGGEKD